MNPSIRSIVTRQLIWIFRSLLWSSNVNYVRYHEGGHYSNRPHVFRQSPEQWEPVLCCVTAVVPQTNPATAYFRASASCMVAHGHASLNCRCEFNVNCTAAMEIFVHPFFGPGDSNMVALLLSARAAAAASSSRGMQRWNCCNALRCRSRGDLSESI